LYDLWDFFNTSAGRQETAILMSNVKNGAVCDATTAQLTGGACFQKIFLFI
jgi:hypothetical protein